MQDSLILREHLDLQYILLGNDFMKSNSVSISYKPDTKSVLINDHKVRMLEPFSPSHKVDIFSAILKKISYRVPSVKDLPAVPDISLPESLSEIPPDLPQNEPPLTSSDYLFDESLKSDIQQFFNLCPEDDHKDIAINTFMAECKAAKYNYYNESFVSYSAYTPDLDEILRIDSEKRSIIPDMGSVCPQPNLSHLSSAHQERMLRMNFI